MRITNEHKVPVKVIAESDDDELPELKETLLPGNYISIPDEYTIRFEREK